MLASVDQIRDFNFKEDKYMSENESNHRGLPVAGYKPTQTAEAIRVVNHFKELEERVLRSIDEIERKGGIDEDQPVDLRWLSIGRTQLQQAFMALNRAVFQPGRVSLPTDGKQSY